MRHLARIVRIDAIAPIRKADAIEAAQVGGWKVVVKKGEFSPGDLAVYFEIDTFLPQGNPAWEFLVQKSAVEFNGTLGHVLRSVTLRGQLSQGLLLALSSLTDKLSACTDLSPGVDVTEVLGVLKYEPPVPECLQGLVVGAYPSRVPKSDQERIQNLSDELTTWQQAHLKWELTEKLEGQSATFAVLEGRFHVCAKTWSLAEKDDNVLWRLARGLRVEEGLAHYAPSRQLALQGELVGPGIEGNIYRFDTPRFYLYNVYDVEAGRYLTSAERFDLCIALGLLHVPLLEPAFELTPETSMEELLAMADGESMLKVKQRREGVVFKALTEPFSFKAVSNAYLTGQPLK